MTATLTSPTFVGRTEELARLAAAADRAAAGTPTSVLIGGEAGVGKTRLVGELVAGARAAGATVLAGGCVELGGEGVPFAPLIEALRALVRDLDEPALARLVPGQARAELARLLPELSPTADPDPGGTDPVRRSAPRRGSVADGEAAFDRLSTSPGPWSEQGRLFELLLGVLERLGAEGRAVLVVEDLHWADRSTRDLLAFLIRNLRHGRLLLVGTYRSDELHRRHPLRPFLAELDRGRRVERLELARFGPDEVAAQLAGIQGAPVPAELAERIHARSGGNAFFVEELAATAGGAERELPPSLRDTLLARIELLAEPAQQVLEVASVAGAAVADPLLAEVAGLPEAELLAGLREAVSAHVLLADAGDGTYGFRHALVKEAVYAELLPGERTRLHARFAAALAARDSDDPGLAAELAWHWYAAHDLERALPAAVRAGLAAERAYAFAEAQRQFERALELWERCGEPAAEAGMDKAELLARAGEAAANAGAADRAVALVRAALAEVDPAADPLLAGQLTERLAFHLRVVGRPGAFEAYQEAVRLVPPGPTVARARVLAGLGQALMLRARFAEAIAICEEAIEVARAAGDP
ncbi:MAG TPA: AAA family ATPase, partial [Actinomycetota bacterium]|nr:AAA family ATPase [Actinomycetota bacterium]